MITMVLEQGVAPEKIKSLLVIRAGTAPLDPETQRAFEEAYGIPVLTEYSASDFMGGIAGWSLADHKLYGESKRGAAGTLRPDLQVKIKIGRAAWRERVSPSGYNSVVGVALKK